MTGNGAFRKKSSWSSFVEDVHKEKVLFSSKNRVCTCSNEKTPVWEGHKTISKTRFSQIVRTRKCLHCGAPYKKGMLCLSLPMRAPQARAKKIWAMFVTLFLKMLWIKTCQANVLVLTLRCNFRKRHVCLKHIIMVFLNKIPFACARHW